MIPASARALGVTGAVVEDTIETVDGAVVRDLGGILYAIEAARALVPEPVAVVPVLGVGTDALDRVTRVLSASGVTSEGVVPDPAVNNKVRLVYRSADEREETLTGGVGPLAWEALAPWLDRLDAWLVNLVAGNELERATFERLKRNFDGVIHLDLHSLCLEPPGAGPRRPRRPDRWEAWVEGVSWVQCNEREAGLLWRGRPEPLDGGEEGDLAARIHALGSRGVLVTRGDRGATWRPADGEPVSTSGHTTRRAVDPTGCGDVFGAAWIALAGVRGIDPADALAASVRAAGVAASIRGTRELGARLAEAGVEADTPSTPERSR